MKKNLTLLFILFLTIEVFAQHSQDTVFTCASAIISIHIDDTIPLAKYRGKIHSYNIYKISVDSVYLINVYKEFEKSFSKEYLKSCKFLFVYLDTTIQNYYYPKTDWDPSKEYIISTDVGFGKRDLTLQQLCPQKTYVADKQCIIMCSFFLLCPSMRHYLISLRLASLRAHYRIIRSHF